LIQSQILEEAIKKVAIDDPAIMVYDPSWHEGVIGIVASRLVELYKRPAIVLSKSDALIKGSARSYANLDLYQILLDCSHLFTKFGGHEQAAGITIPEENLETFKRLFFEKLSSIKMANVTKEIYPIDANKITAGLVKHLEFMGPFGPSNPRPIFKMRGITVESYRILKEKHLSLTLKSRATILQAISFNHIGNKINPSQLGAKKLELTFNLGINYFNGNQFLQLFIDDIAIEN
jgi:single-stranded-DNA-specific exonuclease